MNEENDIIENQINDLIHDDKLRLYILQSKNISFDNLININYPKYNMEILKHNTSLSNISKLNLFMNLTLRDGFDKEYLKYIDNNIYLQGLWKYLTINDDVKDILSNLYYNSGVSTHEIKNLNNNVLEHLDYSKISTEDINLIISLYPTFPVKNILQTLDYKRMQSFVYEHSINNSDYVKMLFNRAPNIDTLKDACINENIILLYEIKQENNIDRAFGAIFFLEFNITNKLLLEAFNSCKAINKLEFFIEKISPIFKERNNTSIKKTFEECQNLELKNILINLVQENHFFKKGFLILDSYEPMKVINELEQMENLKVSQSKNNILPFTLNEELTHINNLNIYENKDFNSFRESINYLKDINLDNLYLKETYIIIDLIKKIDDNCNFNIEDIRYIHFFTSFENVDYDLIGKNIPDEIINQIYEDQTLLDNIILYKDHLNTSALEILNDLNINNKEELFF